MTNTTESSNLPSSLDGVFCAQFAANCHCLTVGEIMTREVVTATPEEAVFNAAKKMSDNSVSCVVVMDADQVVGILTDRDILDGIAGNNHDFRRLRVAEQMSAPVEAVSPGMSVMAAGTVMTSKRFKRLPVVEECRLVGIVTQTDITRGLISISPRQEVGAIMTTQVVTVTVDATLTEAARIMASRGISCLVAMNGSQATGIVTEKDLLRRTVALQRDPSTTRVAEIMSVPLVTISPQYSVLGAGRKMDKLRIHRLLVTEGSTVCGVVTQTDILQAIRDELQRLDRQRKQVAGELDGFIRSAMQHLEQLRASLSRSDESST
jgi:CBS domain-containing protein